MLRNHDESQGAEGENEEEESGRWTRGCSR